MVTVICAHSCAPRHQHGLHWAGAVEVHPKAQTLRGPQLLMELERPGQEEPNS